MTMFIFVPKSFFFVPKRVFFPFCAYKTKKALFLFIF